MTSTFETIDEAIAALIPKLERIADRDFNKKYPKPVVAVTEPWACYGQSLDFLTRPDGNHMPITAAWSRQHSQKLSSHLAVCARCTTKTECLEMAEAYGDTIGIWGGLMPHEREI